MTKKIYKITGMDCPSCAALLESDLEDAGIKCSCSFAKSELTVEHEEIKAIEAKIIEVILKSGYSLSSDKKTGLDN